VPLLRKVGLERERLVGGDVDREALALGRIVAAVNDFDDVVTGGHLDLGGRATARDAVDGDLAPGVRADLERRRPRVRLRRGRVAVSGPIVGDELVLRPGQVLSVNLPQRETRISESGDERTTEPSAAPAGPATSAAAALAARPRTLPVPSAGPAASSGRHWREALASGQWDLILAEAERGGLDATIKTLSSDELFALADAARYRRRPEIARSALLAVRERFPRSPRALDAVFLLGRVEELRASGKAKALAWYDEYLGRAPGGTYAAEALGRKMILVKETAGAERARQIASEYLERFPSGSYAEAARSLEQSH